MHGPREKSIREEHGVRNKEYTKRMMIPEHMTQDTVDTVYYSYISHIYHLYRIHISFI